MSDVEERASAGEEVPPKKKLRMSSRSRPVRRTQKSRKCKKATNAPPLNLCNLPTEILEKIIGNINIWHHNRIRGTCRRLKYVDDIFVMHEFQKATQKYISQDPKSEVSAALRVIKLATELFVHSGFESVFCGCILPMQRASYMDPFCFTLAQIKQFLTNFYNRITDIMGETSQRWRLLYTMTLMQLIKAFDKSILSSSVMALHWRVVVKLRGPWLGCLWCSKGQTRGQPRHRCDLLVILADMLIADITQIGFKNIWQCPNEMYVFGNDTSKSNRVPTTLFTFTVYGSKKICSLLSSCLEGGPESFQSLSKWPSDQFTVNLDIICKEAMKWGCSKSQHMELGPFSGQRYGVDDVEENNFDFENL